ncbi:spore germination protein [Paenibacillus cymbidii]|uniref:spore germination protein n=1 Tax=Paenibacillus cymbidii TaxID=1639034 RepID=UPI0010815CB1|nr:spore germination protein [Paenibacillus cymbidii]
MQPLSLNLAYNRTRLEHDFADCDDLAVLPWQFGPNMENHAVSLYFNTLVQQKQHNYMKLALQDLVEMTIGPGTEVTIDAIRSYFGSHVASNDSANLVYSYEAVKENILNGDVVIMFDGWNVALAFHALSLEKRQVAEPSTESVVQGPREGTVEDLTTNIGLIRSRIRSHLLKLEYVDTGGTMNTRLAYIYVENAVDPNTLTLFRERIASLDVEVLEASYVEQVLEDSTMSPFPQVKYTERTDVAAANLMDGKIAVLVQGTGTVLICPGLFSEFLQTAEDYYQRTLISTLIRLMRWVAFFIALTLPSIYVALSTYHTELIPTVLLLAIIDSREGIPFPAFFEALIMEFFFELLREAGIRLPKPVGSAVSIVGALVIGEAAINAGIASPIMVVIVAITGIASFALPQYNLASALRILRFPLMMMAAFLGGFGVMIGMLWILLHMTSLRALGEPYMTPLAPAKFAQWRDIFIRGPLDPLIVTNRNKRMLKKR